MEETMKKELLTLAAALTLAVGCGEDTETDDTDTPVDPPADTAQLRVAHFSPDAPAVDIFVNAGAEAAFSGAAFSQFTDYAELPVDTYDVQISAAGTTAADAVFTVEGIAVEKDASYTAIAHGYLAGGEDTSGFTVSLLEDDRDGIPDGFFRVQVVHAAALGAFANVDVWSVGGEPVALIPDFPYADAVTTELPSGAYTICLDVNADAACDAVFALPEISSGFVNLIATNDTDGVPFLIAVLDDGTQARIDATPQ